MFADVAVQHNEFIRSLNMTADFYFDAYLSPHAENLVKDGISIIAVNSKDGSQVG